MCTLRHIPASPSLRTGFRSLLVSPYCLRSIGGGTHSPLTAPLQPFFCRSIPTLPPPPSFCTSSCIFSFFLSSLWDINRILFPVPTKACTRYVRYGCSGESLGSPTDLRARITGSPGSPPNQIKFQGSCSPEIEKLDRGSVTAFPAAIW